MPSFQSIIVASALTSFVLAADMLALNTTSSAVPSPSSLATSNLTTAPSILTLPLSPEDITTIDSYSNETQIGTAFWALQNGQAGACGFVSDDTDYVVGLPMGFYNASMGMISPFCNQFVVLTNPADNATVTARVSDATNTPSSIVLSVGAISMINQGSPIGNVTWTFANVTQVEAAIAGMDVAAASLLATPTLVSSTLSTREAGIASSSRPASTPATISTPAPAPSSAFSSSPTPSSSYSITSSYSPKSRQTESSTSPSAQPSSSPESGGGTFSGGVATYFTQNGVAGACGEVNSDETMLVAIDEAMYAGGSNCGRQVSITRTSDGRQVTAVVADMCPTCDTDTSLDLSQGAFEAIASQEEGKVDISWSFI